MKGGLELCAELSHRPPTQKRCRAFATRERRCRSVALGRPTTGCAVPSAGAGCWPRRRNDMASPPAATAIWSSRSSSSSDGHASGSSPSRANMAASFGNWSSGRVTTSSSRPSIFVVMSKSNAAAAARKFAVSIQSPRPRPLPHVSHCHATSVAETALALLFHCESSQWAARNTSPAAAAISDGMTCESFMGLLLGPRGAFRATPRNRSRGARLGNQGVCAYVQLSPGPARSRCHAAAQRSARGRLCTDE